jgi:predicted MFS family arabinose efflux permease
MLIATPLGGVAADRLPRRTVMMVGQLLLSGGPLVLALTLVFDVTRYWMLIAGSVFHAVGFALYNPARVAFSAETVPSASLPNALALTQMGASLAQVVGPAVAGVLIGVDAIGVKGAYLLTAGLGAVACLVTLRLPHVLPSRQGPARSVLQEVRDGVAYVRGSHELTLLVVITFVVIMAAFPYIAFLPAVADGIFDIGPGGYAFLSVAAAVGATIASVAVARTAGSHAFRVLTLAGVALAVGLLLLAIAPVFAAAVAATAVVGAGAAAFQSTSNTLALTNSSLEYHGRVQSLMFLSVSGFALLALPLGLLADAVGLRQTFAGMAVTALAAMAVYVRLRQRFVPPIKLHPPD